MDIENEVVGVVLGSRESAPLDFWVGVEEGKMVQLDDLIVLETVTPGRRCADLLRNRRSGN